MKTAYLMMFCLATGMAHAGEMFRWVDADGKVHYTDQPPPASAKKVEEKKLGGSSIETSQLPYATQQAVKNYPVTLYVSDCGESCNAARAHLSQRGVPFTTKNPQTTPADYEALKKLIGEAYVPVLVVGSSTSKGYEKGAWDAALDMAGYPQNASPRKPAPKAGAAAGAAAKPAEPQPEAPPHPWAKGK